VTKPIKNMLRNTFYGLPLLSWLGGAFVSVCIERLAGPGLIDILGLPKIPVLFGLVVMLKEPLLVPSAVVYVTTIYALPLFIVARLSRSTASKTAGKLLSLSVPMTVVLHLALLYATLHIWSGVSAYRVLTLKLTLIAVMLTLSLNVINGYMGEFSCSHPGFMALGAYASSVFSVLLFTNDKLFGAPLLPSGLGPYLMPLGLVLGGMAAAVGALVIAIPSFRTRGDYLAIISLAFMFIVKSVIENLEIVGGPRGLSGQPDWANLPTVFLWTILCVWIINNFVRSTLGKALNAVRDDEMAAEAMTVNTRRTKMTAFLFGAFWAGVAGGLFAHVLRYVNPATFGLQKLIIPLLLILVMIFRPTGLVAFKEFNVKRLINPRQGTDGPS
jgi:branched-chain amino acid transport system permease protein